MLNAAANCYTCSLELEVNDKNKKNLYRRIGNVYNEITSAYINEIASELLCHKIKHIFLPYYLLVNIYIYIALNITQ